MKRRDRGRARDFSQGVFPAAPSRWSLSALISLKHRDFQGGQLLGKKRKYHSASDQGFLSAWPCDLCSWRPQPARLTGPPSCPLQGSLPSLRHRWKVDLQTSVKAVGSRSLLSALQTLPSLSPKGIQQPSLRKEWQKLHQTF